MTEGERRYNRADTGLVKQTRRGTQFNSRVQDVLAGTETQLINTTCG